MLPKSIFPFEAKTSNNIVWLSAREHFICHWLATKMFIDTTHARKMQYAFGMFLNHNRYMQRSVCSRQFVRSKQRYQAFIKEHGAHNLHKPRSDEFKQAMAARARGKKASPETKERMSERKTGSNNFMYGKTHSQETRNKISTACTGRQAHNQGKPMDPNVKAVMQNTKRAASERYIVRCNGEVIGTMTILEFCELHGYKYYNAYGSITKKLKYFNWQFELV